MRKFAALALIALMPSSAVAQHHSGGTDITLTSVLLEGAGIYIGSPDILNPDGCQISGRAALPNDATAERYMSLAVTALTTGTKVQIWVAGCTAAPWGTVPAVYNIALTK